MQTSDNILDQHGFSVDAGVIACRMPREAEDCTIPCSPDDILWVTALDDTVNCILEPASQPVHLHTGESALLLWPRSTWALTIQGAGAKVASIFRISLDALHRILAVDFSTGKQTEGGRMDYSKLSRVVHLSPLLIQNLESLFIQSEQSMFRNIAQRGIFLNTFAQMLELLYGTDIDQCPFHIDMDTERKIRAAQQLLIDDLQNIPDLQSLAFEVDLPKAVLKEGFSYLYGKNIPAYLQDFKFEKATTMLESGKYLIKEVAFEIGYQNPSHFISAFKQRFGTTPKQWLKQSTGV